MIHTIFKLAAAALLLRFTSAQKLCWNHTIPLSVESEDFVLSTPPFKSNYDVADFVTNITSRTAATDFNPFAGTVNKTHSYNISATFCTPANPRAKYRDTVLVATHGLNFDRQYWYPSFVHEKYSFVDYAIGRGYSVFFYDRVGVGQSSSASGYSNQLSSQVGVLLNLGRQLQVGHYTGPVGVPKALVAIGHSFGSSISAATTVLYPDLFKALVLTGYSYNGTNGLGFIQSAQLRIAATQDAVKWKALDSGQLTPVDVYSNANTFFKEPDYDPAVLEAVFARRQPIALSEFLTFATGDQTPTTFRGKAMVIAGQHDFIFCTGQCDAVIEHPAKEIFSKASAFRAVSYPHAGHALNFASNAPGAFKEIFDFLEAGR